MGYILGSKSLSYLTGVHPDLFKIIQRGIEISKVDFGVTERQVRDLEYQKHLVAIGSSQTLKSNHLEQIDLTSRTKNKYGHAVDLVPWINGKYVWDWNAIYEIVVSMAESAASFGLIDKLCWGGCWDKWVSEYPHETAKQVETAKNDYSSRTIARKKKAGIKPATAFVDGPHFQLYKLG